MPVTSMEDLLLAELAGDEGADGAAGRSLSALIDALGTSSARLSGQLAFATALEDLRSRGLVTTADGGSDATAFALTAAGVERASDVRERLANASITVVDGDRRRLALSEAAAELERSPVEIAAECTADGVYYHDDAPVADALVDRDVERERCRGILEAVRDDRSGRAIFLTGPSGVGKTTLAEAVLESARESGFEVLRARCRKERDPFGPVRELLDGLEAATAPFDDVDASVEDPDAFRARQTGLFHDVTAALALEAGAPVRVCFLDDLHLADPATISYLEFLLDRLDEHPIAVLFGVRATAAEDDASVATDALEIDLGERLRDERFVHVELDTLGYRGTRGVIERVVGRRGAPDAFVDAVHERTGGNPLFVEETVSRLLETDQLDPRYEWYPEAATAIDVPESVTTTIERRIDDLDADARRLLRWAAVVGVRSPVDALETVCSLPPQRVSTLLEGLASADVFDWVDDRTAVAFRTEVVRDALREDLSAATRREYHAAVADALEELATERPPSVGADGPSVSSTDHDQNGATDDESARPAGAERAASIASHHERAGNDAAAIAWFRRAGERATEVYAHEAATEHYRSALALARAGDEGATLLDVAERLAEIYATTGEFDDAERYVAFATERATTIPRRQRLAALSARIDNARGEYESAIERTADALAFDDGPAAIRCRLLDRKAKAHRELGDLEDADGTSRRHLEESVAVDEPLQEARALRQLGSTAQARGDHETARNYLESALETFRTAGDPLDVAKARHALGNAARAGSDLEAAAEHYRRALAAYEAVGARRLAAMTRMNCVVVAIERGEYDGAREGYRDAIETLRAIGDRHTAATARMNLGLLVTQRGEYEVALAEYRRALESFDEIGDRHNGGVCHMNVGYLALERGDFERARIHLEAALETFESIGDRPFAAKTRTNLGLLALERGEFDRARSRLTAALREGRAVDDDRNVAEARLALGRLATRRGEWDAAAERLAAALETFEALDERRFVGKTRRALGLLALERGDEGARDHLTGALETLRAVEARHDVARVRLALGREAIERGSTDRARDHLENALEAFEDVDARETEVAATRRALGRVDAATGAPARARERWRLALEGFESVGATDEALETLERLVSASLADGEAARGREWLERATVLVASTDGDDADRPVWLERAETELASRAPTADGPDADE